MALSTLDDFLLKQYQHLGLSPPQSLFKRSGFRFAPATPEATQDFPRPTHEQFTAGLVEKKAAERGIFGKLLNVLMAGEYAVASATRSIIRGSKAKTDPVSAFFKGFASAFTDDREYETWMYDILTELGWKDPEGTAGSLFKSGVGLALGILFDPLTYMGIGPAARATKITGKQVQTIAKMAGKAGKKIPEKFTKGQYLNRFGRRVYKAFRKEYGAIGSKEALEDLTRLTLYTDNLTLREALKVKPVKLIERALKAMNKPVTTKNIEWFAKGGYKQLLDPGGLRFLNLRFFTGPSGFLTPRVSSLHGLLMGDTLKTSGSLAEKAIEGLRETRVWKGVTARIDTVLEPLRKYFHANRGLDEEGVEMINLVRSSVPHAREVNNAYAKGLFTAVSKKTESVTLHKGLTVELPKEAAIRLMPNERRLVGRILHYARVRGLEGADLDNWVVELLTNPKHEYAHWLKPYSRTARPKGLGLDHIAPERKMAIREVTQRVQGLFKRLLPWEAAQDFGTAVAPAYFPRQYKGIKPGSPLHETFHNLDWDKVYDDFHNLVKGVKRSVPGELEDDALTIVQQRLGESLRKAYLQDALTIVTERAARHPQVLKGLAKVVSDPKFIRNNPELAVELAGVASKLVDGIDIADLGFFRQLLSRIDRNLDPAGITKEVTKFINAAKTPKNLSQAHVDQLIALYQGTLRKKASDLTGLTGSVLAENTKALVAAQNELPRIITELNKNLATKTTARALELELGKVSAKYVPGLKPIAPHYEKTLTAKTAAPTSLAHDPGQFMAASRKMAADLKLPAKTTATYLNEAQNVTRRLQTFSSDVKTWGSRVAAHKTGGLPSSAVRASFTHGQKVAGDIDSRLVALGKEIQDLSFKRQTTYRTAQMGQKMTEYRTLAELRKQLPAEKFFGKRADSVAQLVEDTAKIRNIAKSKGLEDYVSALSRRFVGGDPALSGKGVKPSRPLEALSRSQRTLILRQLSSGAGSAKAARELLTAPKETEAFAKAVETGLKVRHPVTKKWEKLTEFVIPKDLAREINRVLKPKEASQSRLLHFFDQGLSLWKRWVTSTTLLGAPRAPFFSRNLVDLAFRGSQGLGTRYLWDSALNIGHVNRVLLGRKGHVLIDGIPVSYDAIRQIMVDSGLWRRGFEKLGPRGTPIHEQLLKKLSEGVYESLRYMKDRLHELLDRIPVLRRFGPERLGTYMENVAVASGIISQMKAGIPVDDLVRNLQRSLFSYNNLTDFERGICRRLIPFYSFSRQSVPFVAWATLKRPALITSIPRLRGMSYNTKEEEALLPDWIKEFPHVSAGKIKNGFRVMSLRNTFAVDIVNELLQPMSAQGFRRYLAQVNPIIMAPLEYAFGKNLYFNQDIKEVKTLTRELQSPILKDTIGKFLNAREVTLGDKKMTQVDGMKWYLLKRLWFSRLFRELDTMSSVITKDMPPVELWGIATGFKIMEIDSDRQQILLENEAAVAKQKYDRAIRRGDNVQAKKILEEFKLR